MVDSWRRLAAHAEKCHGVVTSAAARQLGIATSTLAAWHEMGRLQRVAPEAYQVSGTPDSWLRRVAVATASSHGWASHATAAALWQLDGFQPGPIEVLTTKGRRRERPGRWTVHETRRLRGVDLTSVRNIPCTTVARTILDLPAVAHLTLVGRALDSACNRWPGMLDTVGQRFLELGGRGRPGTRVLRMLLEERAGTGRFAQSGFESMTARLVRRIGLPAPVLQHMVRDGAFVAYLDLAWPPIRWGIECDSLAWHSGKHAHETDRYRRRQLKRLGWDIVEVTWDDVTSAPTALDVTCSSCIEPESVLSALSTR